MDGWGRGSSWWNLGPLGSKMVQMGEVQAKVFGPIWRSGAQGAPNIGPGQPKMAQMDQKGLKAYFGNIGITLKL